MKILVRVFRVLARKTLGTSTKSRKSPARRSDDRFHLNERVRSVLTTPPRTKILGRNFFQNFCFDFLWRSNFNLSWQVVKNDFFHFFTLFKISSTLGKATQLINEQELSKSSGMTWQHCIRLSHDTCHFETWRSAAEIFASEIDFFQFWKKSDSSLSFVIFHNF